MVLDLEDFDCDSVISFSDLGGQLFGWCLDPIGVASTVLSFVKYLDGCAGTEVWISTWDDSISDYSHLTATINS